VPTNVPASFGPLLRKWRLTRSYSQQRLASDSEVSTRHLSFLETSRAAPSREMVLLLASALELPLRERNGLLVAAGFAPVYRESALDGAELAHVRRALDYVLAQQEPYGAVVVDRVWNVLRMNVGTMRLFGAVLGDTPPPARPNVVDLLFAPGPFREAVVNWEEVAGPLVERLHREIAAEPEDQERRTLLATILAYPDVPQDYREARLETVRPFVPLQLRVRGEELRFFTMISTLGTPLDVTAQELRIETYFPADDATELWCRNAARA